MDLSYSDEQRLLKESADGLLSARAQKPGAADLWKEMADLGWLAMPLPEEHEGLGQGPVDVAILTESFGRWQAVTPYVPAVVVCGGIVAALGDEQQKKAILPALAQGASKLALAHAEDGARHTLSHVATKAARAGDGWRLDGHKIAVLAGDAADRLIVSARIDGDARDERGIGLFVIDRATAGLTIEPYATVDGAAAARATLADVTLGADALLGGTSDAFLRSRAPGTPQSPPGVPNSSA